MQHQWTAESFDAPDLALPDNQGDLIKAIAACNRRTVVVLETGGPVCMPWLLLTAAVIEAWYPGARGGEAVARVLFGEVNPSRRLPITFPASETQLLGNTITSNNEVDYFEDADVGYKWFDKNGLKPLFSFGFGLSYTTFDYNDLTATVSGVNVILSLNVKNVGMRRGADVPQFYVRRLADFAFPIRLVGWFRVQLDPGETRRVTVTIEPRLLARFNNMAGHWEIEHGRYEAQAGASAGDLSLAIEFTLPAFQLKP